MSEIIELFKTRLAQLKKVLERDGKISEALFDKAMQLEKSEALKKEIMDILTNHKFKIKKGYISLPTESGDKEAIVREFFRETFDTLVKAFGFDMAELVTKEQQSPKTASALQLFEMQDELAAGEETGVQAFESTMQELDSIDTSTPLESIMDISPPVEDETTETTEIEQTRAEETILDAELPSEKIEEEIRPGITKQQVEEPYPVPSPPAIPLPVKRGLAPGVPTPPPAEIAYTYYVCSRCGAEISKKDIKQSGSYLECPQCNFTFSRAEATVIQKKPGNVDKSGPRKVESRGKVEPGIEQSEQGESFNLFADKGDESLVRPSDLFKSRKDEFGSEPRDADESRQPLQPREKPRKPEPGERLVRPSEYLGQLKDNAATEESTSEPAIIPETVAEESQEPGIEPNTSSASQVQEESNTGGTQPVEETPVETPIPTFKQHQIPKAATPVPEKLRYSARESQMIGDHLVKPSERVVRPSELREIAMEKKDAEEKCPRCGSTKFTKIQDRTKIVSYNPLLYGSRKKCTMCSFIFD
ncbi:MAG TPA: hypothetical protein VKM55_18645 [Candidatus Lokiarchaeia archaeon]|nr:hypothetical protein [Candidatus Lokiarchaeia archaeon]